MPDPISTQPQFLKMQAEFYARGTKLWEDSPTRTVIYGDILDGKIREGMYVHIPINRVLSVSFQIERIEYTKQNQTDKGHVILVLKPEDIDDAEIEADFIDMLNIGNEVLFITKSEK